MAGVAFAVEGDGVGFATESYAASALYATLANLSAALWRIRRVSLYTAHHDNKTTQHERADCSEDDISSARIVRQAASRSGSQGSVK
jgi:hypothetical protein